MLPVLYDTLLPLAAHQTESLDQENMGYGPSGKGVGSRWGPNSSALVNSQGDKNLLPAGVDVAAGNSPISGIMVGV